MTSGFTIEGSVEHTFEDWGGGYMPEPMYAVHITCWCPHSIRCLGFRVLSAGFVSSPYHHAQTQTRTHRHTNTRTQTQTDTDILHAKKIVRSLLLLEFVSFTPIEGLF
jgi:hypothetical protein